MSASKFYKTQRKILYRNYFVIKILEETQQIFNHDCKHETQIEWLMSDVTDGYGLKWCTCAKSYNARQIFCLDVFLLAS